MIIYVTRLLFRKKNNHRNLTNPEPLPKPPRSVNRVRSFDQITGMTAQQRFILAVMLLVMVCLLGTMFLVITGKMVPSFLV